MKGSKEELLAEMDNLSILGIPNTKVKTKLISIVKERLNDDISVEVDGAPTRLANKIVKVSTLVVGDILYYRPLNHLALILKINKTGVTYTLFSSKSTDSLGEVETRYSDIKLYYRPCLMKSKDMNFTSFQWRGSITKKEAKDILTLIKRSLQ